MGLFLKSYSEGPDRTYHFPTFGMQLASHVWFDVKLLCDCQSQLFQGSLQFRFLTRLFLKLQRVKAFLAFTSVSSPLDQPSPRHKGRPYMALGFPGDSDSKESACNTGDWIRSLGWEDPPEKGMATYSSVLAWKIPWTEEPQSIGSQRDGHDQATNTFTFTLYDILDFSFSCRKFPFQRGTFALWPHQVNNPTLVALLWSVSISLK